MQQRPGKDRGPHLAELELQCRLIARRDEAAGEGRGMLELLAAYFERFGSKPCCMTDLKLYVSSLESSERDEFFSRTAECISQTDNGVPSTVRLRQLYSNLEYVRVIFSLKYIKSCDTRRTDGLRALLSARHEKG